jgi:hypothetical protein
LNLERQTMSFGINHPAILVYLVLNDVMQSLYPTLKTWAQYLLRLATRITLLGIAGVSTIIASACLKLDSHLSANLSPMTVG